ncbi:hypothetical protein IWX81_002869 [Salinibacterium sp. CAN_S4]|uniref:hypothetical protein n=1 Tax=Salinibacterium sp. CAN_S4 TaxID=2787727 RepID=UPI0018EF46A1
MSVRKAVLKGLAVAAVLTFVTTAPAAAADIPSDPTALKSTVTTAMVSHGFDENVARDNGFEIRVNSVGEQYSVPVSESAKTLVEQNIAASAGPGSPTTRGSGQVFGPCGSSTIYLYKSGLSVLKIQTSYSVNLPIQFRQWGVVGASGSGVFNVPFNSPYPGTAFWTGYGQTSVAGGGWGQVAIGSYVMKVDGNICWAGAPSAGF